jgi:hypothetical protein
MAYLYPETEKYRQRSALGKEKKLSLRVKPEASVIPSGIPSIVFDLHAERFYHVWL